jgi:type 1 glutamine amidotransferase
MKTFRSILRFVALACALLPAVTAVAADGPKKVLVVTVTTGFRHASIPVAEKVLSEMAARSGKFTVEFVRQPDGMPKAPPRPRPGPKGAETPEHQAAMAKFAEAEKVHKAAMAAWMPNVERALQKLSPANLKNYDAVLFASTTGDDFPLPDHQGFLDWIASGKAFIGVHAATDTLKAFGPYVSMIGGAFRTHGPQVRVECINEDPSHASCANLPKRWTVFDEIYEFKNHDSARVHDLLTLDKHPQTNAPGPNPVAWARNHGRGRVFYTSLGHREDVWDPTYSDKDGRKNPPEVARQFQAHLTGGILWALGLAEGKASHQN